MVANLNEEEIQEMMDLLKLKHEDIFEFSNLGRFYLNTLTFKKQIINVFKENIIDKVWKKSGDLYIINAGKEGSGKSLFSIWLAYILSKEYNKELDPFLNIALDHDEWISAQGRLKKHICIYDEAYQTFDNQAFNTYEGRSGKEFAIRNRFKQIINILNYPNFMTINYYIKEHRFNLLILNLDLELSTNKTIYVKVFYDRTNALKLLEYSSKVRLIDRFDIIKGKRNQWRPFLMGIFDLSEEFKDNKFSELINIYNHRKELASDELSVNLVFRDFFRRKKTKEIYNYEGNFPYLAYLLIRFLIGYYYKLINLLQKPKYFLNLSGMKKVFFQIKNEKNSKSKEYHNDEDKEVEYIFIPRELVSVFLEPSVFEDAFKDIIQQTTYRVFRNMSKMNNIYYKIKLGDFFYYLDLIKTPFKFSKHYIKLWDLIQVNYENRNDLKESLVNVIREKKKYFNRIINLKDFVENFEKTKEINNKNIDSLISIVENDVVRRLIKKYIQPFYKLES